MSKNSAEPPERNRRTPSAEPKPFTHWAAILCFALVLLLPVRAVAQAENVTDFSASFGGQAVLFSILGILLIIFVNGLFVAGDTALELLRASHYRELEKSDAKYITLKHFNDRRSLYINAFTVGSQTMLVWLVILCVFPGSHLAMLFVRNEVTPSIWIASIYSLLLIAIPVVGLNIIFGELVPRAMATLNPDGTLVKLRGFIKAATAIFGWQSIILTKIAGLITNRFGGRATFVRTNAAETEILNLVETAQESGEIEEQERELIHSVFEFGDTIAREVMTPRVDLDALPVDSEISEIMTMIQETGHSRIPIYEGTDDQIVGIIHAKDLLNLKLDPERPLNIRTLVRPAHFVPESKNLHELLREMKQHRTQLVIVQDEFGGTAGVVTIEDIVEELVGEIVDEYDDETPAITKNGVGFYVDGKVNLYDLNDEIGADFESEEFDTVGGFLFGLFGRQPQTGETITVEGWEFKVEEADGRRIHRLLVSEVQE